MTKMNDNVMVRDIGTLKAFANKKELETLLMEICYTEFMRAVLRKSLNSAKIKMGIHVISELFRDKLVVSQ